MSEKATTPHIIVNIKYNKHYPSEPSRKKYKDNESFEKDLKYYKQSQFFRCTEKNNIISYLTRKDAIDNFTEKELEMLELAGEQNLSKEDIVNNARLRPGTEGLFGLKGKLSKSEIKELKNHLSKTESTVWSGVVSFDEEYGKEHCKNRKQAQEMMSKSFETLCRKQGLDINNLNFFGAYHLNTNNSHIHFVYWEKEKMQLNSKGEKSHSKFKVPIKAVDSFKEKLAYICSLQKKNLDYSLRDEVRKSFNKKNLKTDELQKFIELDQKLGERNSTQYARQTSENKNIINNFIVDFVESKPELNKAWTNYLKQLNDMQKSINKTYAENKIKLSSQAKNFSKSRIDELYSKCGNEILKTLKLIIDTEKSEKEKWDSQKEVYKKNNRNQSANKRGTRNLLTHLMSDKQKDLTNDITKILKAFQKELAMRGDIAIYE